MAKVWKAVLGSSLLKTTKCFIRLEIHLPLLGSNSECCLYHQPWFLPLSPILDMGQKSKLQCVLVSPPSALICLLLSLPLQEPQSPSSPSPAPRSDSPTLTYSNSSQLSLGLWALSQPPPRLHYPSPQPPRSCLIPALPPNHPIPKTPPSEKGRKTA